MDLKKTSLLVLFPALLLLLIELPFWGTGDFALLAILIPFGILVLIGSGYISVKKHQATEIQAGVFACAASVLYNVMKGVISIAILYWALQPDVLLPPVVLYDAAFYGLWAIEGAVSGFALGWIGAKLANMGVSKR